MIDDTIKKFFEEYEKAINTLDTTIFSKIYSDVFQFAGPQGAQVIKKDDFLAMLPKRQQFFATVGLTSTTISSIASTPLDTTYCMVKVEWNMKYEKDKNNPIYDKNAATYIISTRTQDIQIIFQIDHQDLMEKVKKLGLLQNR